MASQSEKMLGTSIFGEPDSFSFRNIQKTLNAYQACLDITPGQGASPTSYISMNDTSVCWFIIAGTVITTFFFFASDAVMDSYKLDFTTPDGRRRLTVRRCACAMLTIIVFTVICSVVPVVYCAAEYGTESLFIPVQSSQFFGNCIFHISIAEYYMIIIAVRCTAACIMALILMILLRLMPASYFGLISFAGFVLVEALSYYRIESDSILAFFRGFNIFSMLDAGRTIGEYLNYNVLGYPVENYVLGLAYMTFTGAVSVVVFVIFVQNKTLSGSVGEPQLSVRMKIRGFFSGIFTRLSLYFKEYIKTFFRVPVYIVLLLICIYGVYNVCREDTLIHDREKAEYESSMMGLAGISDPDTFDIYEKYIQKYEQSRSLLEINLELISDNTDNPRAGFADLYFADACFGAHSDDYIRMLLMFIGVLFGTSYVFTRDIQEDERFLIRTTPVGSRSLFFYKLGIIPLYVLIVYILVYMPVYIILFREYKNVGLDVTIKCTTLYSGAVYDMSLRGLLICGNLYMLAEYIFTGILTAIAGRYLKKYYLLVGILSAVILLPVIFGMFGADIRYFTLNNAGLFFSSVTHSMGYSMIHLAVLCTVTMAAVATIILSRRREESLL